MGAAGTTSGNGYSYVQPSSLPTEYGIASTLKIEFNDCMTGSGIEYPKIDLNSGELINN